MVYKVIKSTSGLVKIELWKLRYGSTVKEMYELLWQTAFTWEDREGFSLMK